MKYAIRDDDTSFFTKPEELKAAYQGLEGRCISLSVIPSAYPMHGDNKPFGDYPQKYYPLHENAELVTDLKYNISAGRYDILLHGFTHEYQKKDGRWLPEMLWKSREQLENDLKIGKEYVEYTLETKVSVLAAPSNAIDQKGIAVLEKLHMDFSGIIRRHEGRAFSLRMLRNFAYRWMVRLIFGIQSPGLLDYGKHREMVAFPLRSYEEFEKEYQFCKRFHKPFVVYTHYWELNQNPENKALLERMIAHMEAEGAECVPLSSLFKRE